MSDEATASLKGMLGLPKNEKTKESEKKAKPKGPKPANRTPPKPRKSTSDLSNNSRKSSDGNNNPTGVKTTRGKRGGGKKNNSADNANEDGNVKSNHSGTNGAKKNSEESNNKSNNNAANSGKKRRNKKRDSQGGNDSKDEEKKTPQLKDAKKYSSDKHNATNYAWSAFQSSPDPSALPDIGGLFLGDGDNEAKVSAEDTAVDEAEAAARELGSSTNFDSSLTFGPPSERIRTSLVNSMLAKTDGNADANAGEALLKSLTSSTRPSFANRMPSVQENKIRTAESLEAEMLSPSLKPEEKNDTDESLPNLNLSDAANDDQVNQGEQTKNEKRDDSERNYTADTEVPQSPNPAEQPAKPPLKKVYPDAITQLMNPGGAYGMLPPMPHHPQHAPYHYPLHHGPPPPGPPPYHGHHGPPYPMPHPQHHPPPYHPMPPNIRPSFTTVQVRVPPSLLPNNMMIVEGMQIQVPPGVPPGAIIPVNIPIPNPQHFYGHPPPHHNPNYHGPPYPHMHPTQHMMQYPPRQQTHPPPPHQQNPHVAPNNPPQTNSWAAKVASKSPAESGKTKPKEESEPKDK